MAVRTLDVRKLLVCDTAMARLVDGKLVELPTESIMGPPSRGIPLPGASPAVMQGVKKRDHPDLAVRDRSGKER